MDVIWICIDKTEQECVASQDRWKRHQCIIGPGKDDWAWDCSDCENYFTDFAQRHMDNQMDWFCSGCDAWYQCEQEATSCIPQPPEPTADEWKMRVQTMDTERSKVIDGKVYHRDCVGVEMTVDTAWSVVTQLLAQLRVQSINEIRRQAPRPIHLHLFGELRDGEE